jgi:hypothetical protein
MVKSTYTKHKAKAKRRQQSSSQPEKRKIVTVSCLMVIGATYPVLERGCL